MIILPKKDKDGVYFVSYSQLSTWRDSKRDYIRRYILGEKFDGNAFTDFGKKVGEALENNDFSNFDKNEQKVLKRVPRYDQFERKIMLHFDGFYVVGYIDTNSHDLIKISDYKTGDLEKVTEKYESDSYDQLEIYAAAIEQETGLLPQEVSVHLIDRVGNPFKGEELKVGKDFVTIYRDCSPEKVLQVKEDILTTVHEISEFYQLYLRLNK